MFKLLINILLVLALVVGVAAVVNPDVRAKLKEIGQQVSQFVAQLIAQIKERAAAGGTASQPDAQTASSSEAGQNESSLDVLVRGAESLWAGLGWGN